MTRFEIGTSGYIGSKKDWLNMPYINCLEINSTFYRLPNSKSIRTYNEMSTSTEHKGLIYSVKVSKFITHMKRLKNCKAAFNKFWRAVKDLGNNLKVLLFQLPPSFKYNKVNMERLKNMTYLPKTNTDGGGLNIVFEFRDKSWFRNDVVVLFEKKAWVLGGTLINKKSGTYWMGTMPSGLHLPEKTTNCTYLRIHGGRGYRGGYDKKELQKIKRNVLKKNTTLNYVIFNNVFFDSRKKTCKYNKRKIRYAALCNASTFGKMTRKRHFTYKRGRGGAQGQTRKKEVELVPMQHEKWLLLGITHTEMEERKYNDPTNGGEMITFDYGGDNYDGGDDRIDIRGNYYNIELWENLLKSKGENYFDVIFQDGGQHAGPGFSNFGDVRERVNLKGINKIMQTLLKPDGLFITPTGLGNFSNGGWIKTDTTIDDPFGRGRICKVFKNPKGARGLSVPARNIPESVVSSTEETKGGRRRRRRQTRKVTCLY